MIGTKPEDHRIPANPIYGLGGCPVDRTAANAVKGGFSHDVKLDPCDSIAPIPTGAPKPGVPNLVGTVFGRFTVIGNTGKKARRAKTSMWVVRCSCGTYSKRSTTAIRNPRNNKDACGRCRHISHIKAHYVFSKTGKAVHGEDYR